MNSSSKRGGFPNVPPPQGTKPASSYARFIPREELGPVAAWTPDGFADPAPRAAAPAAPPQDTAESVAEQLRAQIAAARQAGYQDGYRDGLAALESFKQSFAAQTTARVGTLIDSFGRELDALEGQLAEAVARTAVQLARQVLRAELAQDPTHVARIAAEAVEAVLLSARHITVQVHPQDLPIVQQGADEALQARRARLVASPGIERGGCRVESDVGSVDARIATRWAQAAGALGSAEPWHTEPEGTE